MHVDSFEWDENNIEHVARHHVTPDEVEEVFWLRHVLRRSRDGLYLALGQAVSGRYLFVVFKPVTPLGRVRIITARDMEPPERRLFKKER